MAELSTFQRNLISRGAMAVLALALLYGGYRCIAKGNDLRREYQEANQGGEPFNRRGRRVSPSGSTLPYAAGGLLVLVGGVFAVAAVLPADAFARFMGPPNTARRDDL